ncbi:MAG: transposase [Chloroflexi bacterium]|nr:transposase [Chloroflexota bacterium]MBM4448935.1 transposase [Chloroflexota bacterium]
MYLVEAEGPDGTTFINRRCWLKDSGPEREVWLNYALFMRYTREDKVSQRLAVASLARTKVAPKTEIAHAFGYHRNYVGRLAAELEEQGVEAMLMGKPGPKGPQKLRIDIRRRICQLHKQGLALGDIVRALREERGIRVSRRSVGRVVQEGIVDAKGDNPQATMDSAWSLALPLGMVEAVPSAAPEAPASLEGLTEAAVAPAKAEGTAEVVPEVKELAKPVVKEGREFSGAGGFLYYPAVAALGLVDVFHKVYHKLASRHYGLRELVLALFFLGVMRFSSVEAMKGAQQRDFGCLIGARRSPALKTVRRKLNELVEQKRGHRLVMEMARRYADGDIVELGVLYADGHMKPYYGSRSIGEVWSPQRRLYMPGLQQYFVNDGNGRPLFFLTAQPKKSLAQMLPRLVEHIRSIIGEREFILVFDRGGYSPKVFNWLREEKVPFITYRRKPFDLHPASVFSRHSCQFKGERQEFNLYEEVINIRDFGPIRNIAVLKEIGKQTHILTTDPKTEAALIACLMFNRWGQENFFKYMMEHYSLDALQGYGGGDIIEEMLVANPQRAALDDKVRKLRSEIKAAKEEMGGLVAKRVSRAQLKPWQERLSLLEKQLSALRKRRRELPAKVPLSQTDKKVEALDLEKKTIMDTIKIAAYNAEEWLLERLDHHYNDPRDVRQLLRIFAGLKGRLWLRHDHLVVELTPPGIPKYRRALEGLCAELSQLSPLFPGTSYPIKFAVSGTQVHTESLCPTTPMS